MAGVRVIVCMWRPLTRTCWMWSSMWRRWSESILTFLVSSWDTPWSAFIYIYTSLKMVQHVMMKACNSQFEVSKNFLRHPFIAWDCGTSKPGLSTHKKNLTGGLEMFFHLLCSIALHCEWFKTQVLLKMSFTTLERLSGYYGFLSLSTNVQVYN